MQTQATILIVDDDSDDMELMRMTLPEEVLPLHLVHIPDGQHALDLLREGDISPDLIVLDINMPRMNGFEVLTRLRDSPQWEKLPILMLSTSDAKANLEQSRKLGATDYLVKPQELSGFELIWTSIRYWLTMKEKEGTKEPEKSSVIQYAPWCTA